MLISCRVVACPEADGNGRIWNYYLINDSAITLDSVLVEQISYEWGGMGSSEHPNLERTGLAPGAHVRIHQDDGSGAELRMDVALIVRTEGGQARLTFEFPKLYLKKDFPMVRGLSRRGYECLCQATL